MPGVTESRKGLVIIPSEIRERYGVCLGDEVQIVDYAGRIATIPALKEPIRQERGLLKERRRLPYEGAAVGALADRRSAQHQRDEVRSTES